MREICFKIIARLDRLGLFILLSSSLLFIWFFPTHNVRTADFSVSTAAELNQAIIAANINGEADTITLSASITLTDTLTAVSSNITIDGAGYTVDINNHYRMTYVTGALTVNNLTIINGNNDGLVGGGAILNAGGLLTINGSTFNNNTANANGGSIHNSGTLTITNSTFSSNIALAKGGAIHNDDGIITINNSTFSTNTATTGGGAFSSLGNNAVTTINASTFSGNSTTGVGGDGGGILNDGTLSISNSSFSSNTTTNYDGGAILNLGTTIVDNSTFTNNSARRGGGIYNSSSGSIKVNNSTFSGNLADYGGGILNYTRSDLNSINNSTFHNNTASTNGGGIRNNGILTLKHNLISGNIAPTGAEFFHSTNDNAVTIADDYNVFAHSGLTDAKAFVDFTPGLNDYNATSNIAPSTGNNILLTNILDTTLANNGGPALTHALVGGSPAVDTYNNTLSTCPATDQRNIPRPWPIDGYCDSGAFEFHYATPISIPIGQTQPTILVKWSL